MPSSISRNRRQKAFDEGRRAAAEPRAVNPYENGKLKLLGIQDVQSSRPARSRHLSPLETGETRHERLIRDRPGHAPRWALATRQAAISSAPTAATLLGRIPHRDFGFAEGSPHKIRRLTDASEVDQLTFHAEILRNMNARDFVTKLNLQAGAGQQRKIVAAPEISIPPIERRASRPTT